MPDAKTHHARAITVINLKGGVGKTHTVWLLASICQERGLKVLVIDTDTQANFTSSFLDPAQTVPGVERLFHPGAEQNPLLLVRRTAYPGIDVLPSSVALARFDLADRVRSSDRYERARHVPDVIRQLIAEHAYQIKFVVDQPTDCEEIERYLEAMPEIARDRVWLMPQGTDNVRLRETGAWLEPYCVEQGYRFCPRRHIELFGFQRGT